MAYGFEIYDDIGRLEFSSTETTNGGVFYTEINIPATGTINTWEDIRFDGSYVNPDLTTASQPFVNFKGRTLFYIILNQGTHEIRSLVYGTSLYDFWPRIQYKRPSNITNRYASKILVFIK